jgi:hypothetical protein
VVFAIALSFVPAFAPTPDEMFVSWSSPEDTLRLSELHAPAGDDGPSQSLQDFFAFGDLGPPPGVPGSFSLDPADQAALEMAVRESETSPLNSSDGMASTRVR